MEKLRGVIHEGMATEERLGHLDAALKECIQQISSLQQEREMEVDLKQANKNLICSLVCKQELIDELERDKLQIEAELDDLVTRLDSAEKENAFLKCECCALERQLVETYKVDQLCEMEQENKVLREIIKAREEELCSSKLKCAQVAYRLEVMEADQKEVDCSGPKNSLMSHFIKDNQIVVSDAKGCWPWNALDVILEEHRVSERSIHDLLEEIRVSLAPQSGSETSGLLTRVKPGDSDLNKSICRMIELIEEISPSCGEHELPTSTNIDYSVHVFRWRNSELISILRNLVHCCSLVLNGRNGLDGFVMQLASVLEWAVQNCITLDDASRVRDKVRKHFKLNGSKSETTLNDSSQNVMAKMIKIQSELEEESTWLKHTLRSLESDNKELEMKLSLATENNELLMRQLEESRERIERSEEELEDQIEHLKSINEDLDTQLTVAKVKQNEMIQKLSSLEVELEDKSQCCEDLETTCLELQLQLEILSRKGSPYLEQEQTGQIGWEMISDCSKLALVVRDKEEDKVKRRYSLRDRMFNGDDDDDDDDDDDGGKTEEKATKHDPDSTNANGVLAVVPMKKQGGGFGFIRKMFLRRRKCSSKTNKVSTLLQRNASTMMR